MSTRTGKKNDDSIYNSLEMDSLTGPQLYQSTECGVYSVAVPLPNLIMSTGTGYPGVK